MISISIANIKLVITSFSSQTQHTLLGPCCAILFLLSVFSISNANCAEPVTVKSSTKTTQTQIERILADTKIWLGSGELRRRDNWLNGKSPCSLMQPIQFNQNTVAGLGLPQDKAGFLEANLGDLRLANTGILFLGPGDDDAIYRYKTDTNCSISNTDSYDFQANSDSMSWFNPDNWLSDSVHLELINLMPDSHQIPCAEDTVIFGHPIMGGFLNHNLTSSFQVNFRPASATWKSAKKREKPKLDSISVAQLLVGNYQYNNEEFELLNQDETYSNLLFQMQDPLSVLKANNGFNSKSPLLIDPTSIWNNDDGLITCADETGCWCANEQAEIMDIVCSFHEPLDASELACKDPIKSAGYCNNICGVAITISMDPNKFKENFITSKIYDWFDKQNIELVQFTLVFRRTDQQKYEINIQPLVLEGEPEVDLQGLFDGPVKELTEFIEQQLGLPQIRSFYGINSVKVEKSDNWRSSNRSMLFFGTMFVTFGIFAFFSLVVENLMKF